MITQTVTKIKTDDGEHIALWTIQNSEIKPSRDIFLIHGTFSDKKILMGISRHLARNGARCWIMEWRSHGHSSVSRKPFNFETVAKFDLNATFRYLFETIKLSTIHCVTHSGGGICLTMFLIKHPDYLPKLRSITLLACQSFSAAQTPGQHLKLRLAKLFCCLIGYVPGKKIGVCNESYYTMRQWFDWNLSHQFVGEDQLNYRIKMMDIDTPILSISAENDTFIAPKHGCIDFLDAFSNPRNNFLHYSKEYGSLEDYNHSRILLSKNSSKEIWPVISQWIDRYQ